jgi:hypothetical protein
MQRTGPRIARPGVDHLQSMTSVAITGATAAIAYPAKPGTFMSPAFFPATLYPQAHFDDLALPSVLYLGEPGAEVLLCNVQDTWIPSGTMLLAFRFNRLWWCDRPPTPEEQEVLTAFQVDSARYALQVKKRETLAVPKKQPDGSDAEETGWIDLHIGTDCYGGF